MNPVFTSEEEILSRSDVQRLSWDYKFRRGFAWNCGSTPVQPLWLIPLFFCATNLSQTVVDVMILHTRGRCHRPHLRGLGADAGNIVPWLGQMFSVRSLMPVLTHADLWHGDCFSPGRIQFFEEKRMKKLLMQVGTVGLFLAAAGCAHSGSKALDQKVAEEDVSTRADLTAHADRMISESTTLTENQKAQLTALRDETRTKMLGMRDESLKLRSILIHDVLSDQYNKKEVSIIKKRMKNLESRRLAALFEAVDKANSILGRQASAHRALVDDIFEGHQGRLAN